MTGPAPSVARVFLGLGLGAERGRCWMEAVESALGGPEAAVANFRLARPEGLHVTLYFLGGRRRAELEDLWGAVRESLGGAAGPELELGGTGAFPRRGRERVLWIGVTEPGAEGRLQRLRDLSLAGVRSGGVDTRAEEHRGFRPHVTVARPRRSRTVVPESFYDLQAERVGPEHVRWCPRELCLYESLPAEPAKKGPRRYEPIRKLALG